MVLLGLSPHQATGQDRADRQEWAVFSNAGYESLILQKLVFVTEKSSIKRFDELDGMESY